MCRIHAAIALLVGLVWPLTGAATEPQSYPNRPVRVLMPFPPGGGTDIIGRILAQRLAKAFGQPFIVDNRAGSGGTIATDIVAKAPRDGHTLLVNNISLAVNASLYPKLPYDTLKDLAALSMIAEQPNVLVVHPSVQAHSFRELLEMIKLSPRQLNYGSGGFGSSTYLATELLKLMTKAEIVHVPYKGVGPAMTALLAGQIHLFFSTLGPALPQIKSGKARALGVTTLTRSVYLAGVPTISEAGVPGYEYSTWYGVWLPSGTPRAIANRLYGATEKLVLSAEVKEEFVSQGVDPILMPPDRFDVFCRAEIEKWAKVIRATGAKPE
jgi:tripartite-type tricarboxylate transporter receptor subunit TctC